MRKPASLNAWVDIRAVYRWVFAVLPRIAFKCCKTICFFFREFYRRRPQGLAAAMKEVKNHLLCLLLWCNALGGGRACCQLNCVLMSFFFQILILLPIELCSFFQILILLPIGLCSFFQTQILLARWDWCLKVVSTAGSRMLEILRDWSELLSSFLSKTLFSF